MENKFAIAYADESGRGFSETEPWVLDDFGNDLDNWRFKAKEMLQEGYKRVVVFQFAKEGLEEYTWNYVRQHQIN